MPTFLKYHLPIFFWMLVIFLFSANPDPYQLLPAVLRKVASSPVLEGASLSDFLNPLMHFLSFGILAILISRALFHHRITSQKVVVLSIAFTMAYALSDEIHQRFVPGRTLQFFDLFIDLLGALAGVLIFMKCRNKARSG